MQDDVAGAVAFLYLNWGTQPPLRHLLGSIVRQIVQEQDPLPAVVTQAHGAHILRGTVGGPSKQVITTLLHELSQSRPVYIVIDGLDEFREDTRNDPRGKESRRRLLESILAGSVKQRLISLLITSRLLDEFRALIRKYAFFSVDLKAHHRDVDIFVDQKFDNSGWLQGLARHNPELRSEVKGKISNSCENM